MSAGVHLGRQVLQVLRAGPVWLGLHTAGGNLEGAGWTEVKGSAYGRVEISKAFGDPAVLNLNGLVAVEIANELEIRFAKATGQWDKFGYFGLWTEPAAGKLWYGGPLKRVIDVGANEQFVIDPGILRVKFKLAEIG